MTQNPATRQADASADEQQSTAPLPAQPNSAPPPAPHRQLLEKALTNGLWTASDLINAGKYDDAVDQQPPAFHFNRIPQKGIKQAAIYFMHQLMFQPANGRKSIKPTSASPQLQRITQFAIWLDTNYRGIASRDLIPEHFEHWLTDLQSGGKSVETTKKLMSDVLEFIGSARKNPGKGHLNFASTINDYVFYFGEERRKLDGYGDSVYQKMLTEEQAFRLLDPATIDDRIPWSDTAGHSDRVMLAYFSEGLRIGSVNKLPRVREDGTPLLQYHDESELWSLGWNNSKGATVGHEVYLWFGGQPDQIFNGADSKPPPAVEWIPLHLAWLEEEDPGGTFLFPDWIRYPARPEVYELDEQICKLWNEGLTKREIGTELDLSEGIVAGRIRRLKTEGKLGARPPRRTADRSRDAEIIDCRANGQTGDQIALQLDLAPSRVAKVIRRLIAEGKLKAKASNTADCSRDAEIIDCYKDGQTQPQIALQLDLAPSRIKYAISRLIAEGKLEAKAGRTADRSRDAEIIDCRANGQTRDQIALQLDLAPSRVTRAISRLTAEGKLLRAKAGMTADRSRDAEFIDCRANGQTGDQIALQLKLTPNQVANLIRRLTAEGKLEANAGRATDRSRDAEIIDCYKDGQTQPQIALQLDLAPNEVKNRIVRLRRNNQLPVRSNLTGHQRTSWLDARLKAIGERSGVPGVLAHSFRHRKCTHMYAAGVDTETVQKEVGHHSYAMMRHYVHLANEFHRDEISSVLRIDVGDGTERIIDVASPVGQIWFAQHNLGLSMCARAVGEQCIRVETEPIRICFGCPFKVVIEPNRDEINARLVTLYREARFWKKQAEGVSSEGPDRVRAAFEWDANERFDEIAELEGDLATLDAAKETFDLVVIAANPIIDHEQNTGS